jgi:asparagine synthase (glutamine-hydrolysing)
MCGIAGVLGTPPAGAVDVQAGVDALSHRGPDFSSVLEVENGSFGHTLLSIIGERPMRQPLVSMDESSALTFNGEIYNFIELRMADSEIAAATSGGSDSEVLLEGLVRHGLDFVPKLNGMFAFAFADSDGVGYLVRDRIGIKPLYYEEHESYIVFASELPALAAMTGRTRRPDVRGWYSYVRARYPIGTSTFDAGVRMLPPGHILRFDHGKARLIEYWRNAGEVDYSVAANDVIANVDDLLGDSVTLRMRSDHSFCTFLSGGLDSSLLTAMAARTKPGLQTYSVTVKSEGFDESRYSEQVAAEIGTDHFELLLDQRSFGSAAASLWRDAQTPLGVPNQVAISALSELMSEKHRCVLSGEGADEIFGGYGRIFLMPHDWDALESARSLGDIETMRRFAETYGDDAFSDYAEAFIHRYSYVSHDVARDVLAEMFGEDEIEDARIWFEEHIRGLFDEYPDTDSTDQLLRVFQRLHLPGLLLRLDVATMAHSVEARVPFLDHRLVEYANSLPMAIKMYRLESFESAARSGTMGPQLSEVHDIPKWPLKKAGARYLDASIINRRKMGFPIPPAFYGSSAKAPLAGYEAWLKSNIEQPMLRMHG